MSVRDNPGGSVLKKVLTFMQNREYIQTVEN